MMVTIIKVILFVSLLPMCQLGRDYFKQDTTTTNLLWILNSDIFLEGWEWEECENKNKIEIKS